MKLFFHSKNILLDILFPIYCLGCGDEFENLEPRERWICPVCLSNIKTREQQACPVCEKLSEGEVHHSCKNQTALDGLWVATEYDYELVSKAVHKLKFNFIKDLSFSISEIIIKSILEFKEYGDFQDLIMANFSQESGEEKFYLDDEKNKKAESIIIPVPLHRKRYNWRGFNQSFLLSDHVANKFSLKVYDNLLFRRKNTKPQTKIKSMEERKKNLKGAFLRGNENVIKGNNAIVVDDVCTTLATLNECAIELKKAGAKKVWGLVVARR